MTNENGMKWLFTRLFVGDFVLLLLFALVGFLFETIINFISKLFG